MPLLQHVFTQTHHQRRGFPDLSRRPANEVQPEALEGLMQRFPIDASLPFSRRRIDGWNRLLEDLSCRSANEVKPEAWKV